MQFAVLGIVCFATIAMMVREGFWANLITMFAIVIGGVVAFGAYQPLVVAADEATGGSYTYLLDFPVLWGVFTLVVGVIKGVGGLLSRKKLRYMEPLGSVGGPVVGCVAGVILGSFTLATFHAAPLEKGVLGGALDYGASFTEVKQAYDAAGMLRPDASCLKFVELALRPSCLGSNEGFSGAAFISINGQRRAKYESVDTARVKRG